MALFGLRNKIKTLIKDTLQLEPEDSNQPQYEAQPETSVASSNNDASETEEEVSSHDEPIAAKEEETPVVVASSPAVQAITAEGRDLTPEAVQEVLDDDVRPALQMDGGDIQLVKVEDDNIYVKLVGACSTCPSSVMTMRMGVENLLCEEFPALKELIEVSEQAEESAPIEA
jgi:Fe-S cluster biogenesis protein NfuA